MKGSGSRTWPVTPTAKQSGGCSRANCGLVQLLGKKIGSTRDEHASRSGYLAIHPNRRAVSFQGLPRASNLDFPDTFERTESTQCRVALRKHNTCCPRTAATVTSCSTRTYYRQAQVSANGIPQRAAAGLANGLISNQII